METVAVKEHPILFSPAMVRALLARTKAQTRRIVKPQPPEGMIYDAEAMLFRYPDSSIGITRFTRWTVGDHLWVREKWGKPWHHAQPKAFYAADEGSAQIGRHPDFDGWIPSIHMFRWASRITLEVTEVRVERLQEISAADVEAEGVRLGMAVMPHRTPEQSLVDLYHELWNKINGPGSWEENPFVWKISFKVLKKD